MSLIAIHISHLIQRKRAEDELRSREERGLELQQVRRIATDLHDTGPSPLPPCKD